MSENYLEKRREPRLPASGELVLRVLDLGSPEFRGKLLDISAHGFRLSHSNATLTPGQEVEYTRDGAAGRAKVVWNRIASGEMESGFFVVNA
jgi:hypothetical protein